MNKDTKKTLKDFRERKAEIEERIKAASKTLFAEASAELFNEHRLIENFSWTQYTPYFNDGDECKFSVNNYNPDINGDDWYVHTYKETYDYKVNPDYDTEKKRAFEAVKEFLQEFGEDDFYLMFGDHTKVTVSKDGTVTTEDYNHE